MADKVPDLWDNIHQTNDITSIEEPSIGITTGSLTGPGCPGCIHSHWRWAKFFGEPFGNGQLIDRPSGSKQDFEIGVAKYRLGEDDPADFRDTINTEPIRFHVALNPEYLGLPHASHPEKVVTWYVGTGRQNSDEFFRFGGFYSASEKVYSIFDSLGFFSNSISSGDNVTSVIAENLFVTGNTTVESFDPNSLDPSFIDPLPAEYTVYNSLAREVKTEATVSGPFTTTFTVPSAINQTDFTNLRIL